MPIYQKKLLCFLLTFAIIAPLFFPAIANAQSALNRLETIGDRAYNVTGSGTVQTPAQIVGSIINIALSIVGLVFLILMVYGGYLWMTARGKEERLTKAKETIEAAIIGIIIVTAAYAITFFVVREIAERTTIVLPE